MKNKGFTLVELLAIVILLGIILVLTYPNIVELFERKNEEIDDAKLSAIYAAANQYIENNINEYPKEVGQTYCFNIKDLDSENLIPLEVENYIDKAIQVKIGKSSNYNKIVNECSNDLQSP